jgi:hypothetical protein
MIEKSTIRIFSKMPANDFPHMTDEYFIDGSVRLHK